MGVKSGCLTALSTVSAAVLEYDTPKIVHIKNKKIGALNRIVQLAIVVYIIAWGIIWQKGYQITGPITGTVTTKLKGASYYNGSLGDYTEGCSARNGYMNRTFDVGDYVIPPHEPNTFFVLTNLWQTCNQTQGTCAESSSVFKSNCSLDIPDNNPACLDPDDGSTGYVFEAGNGPTTGRCVPDKDGNGQCEITAWCDVEQEDDDITMAGPKIDAYNFTVLVKASIEFPTIQKGLRKRNIENTHDSNFLKTCRFNGSNSSGLYCPIFTLGQIVDMIENTEEKDFRNISTKGAVVGLEITWDCDHLERNLDHCNPKYVAKRYDDPNAKISQGYNFRYATYYYDEEAGVQKRTLVKAYGILFKVELHGTGGKFDFFTLVLKIGSMIALLGIATIACDVLVLYVVRRRNYYRENKYQNVSDPSYDYEVINHKDAEEMPDAEKKC